jgi:hypothetical protein
MSFQNRVGQRCTAFNLSWRRLGSSIMTASHLIRLWQHISYHIYHISHHITSHHITSLSRRQLPENMKIYVYWNSPPKKSVYEGVSKSFRTGRPARELQMVKLSATRCSCIAILWVTLVSFATITLCVTFQLVFIVDVYFINQRSPETFGYTLVYRLQHWTNSAKWMIIP